MSKDIRIEKEALIETPFKVEISNTEDFEIFVNLNKTYSNFKEEFENNIKYDLDTLFKGLNISFKDNVKYWAVINNSCTENEFLESITTYYLSESDLNKVIETLENGFHLSGICVTINKKIYI